MRTTDRARLNVLSLESREVPACVVSNPTPGTLVVEGDAASDTVVLRDNGAGGISVSATGNPNLTFVGIKNIVVNTRGGDDRVSYNLVRNLQPGQTRNVDVRTEAGNDVFLANLYRPPFLTLPAVGSDLLANSRLVIGGMGGEGNDQMRVDATKDVDVAAGAALKMILFGERGNDSLGATYRGENDGAVSIRELDGGTGNDVIRGYYYADPGSAGVAGGLVHGREGDDTMSLYMYGPNISPVSILDGGPHVTKDIGFANVTVINVPRGGGGVAGHPRACRDPLAGARSGTRHRERRTRRPRGGPTGWRVVTAGPQVRPRPEEVTRPARG